MPDEVKFLATYPSIQSAIKIDGQKNGARIQLDVPETEVGNWIGSMMWRGEVFEVTIKRIEPNELKKDENATISRTSAKRRT